MKFEIFALIACIAAVNAYSKSEEYNKIIEKCIESVDADADVVKSMWEIGETDDYNAKCVMACTFKTKGSMDDDGGINKEIMKQGVNHDIPEDVRNAIIESIDECADQREDDSCDTAYKVFNCMFIKMKPKEE